MATAVSMASVTSPRRVAVPVLVRDGKPCPAGYSSSYGTGYSPPQYSPPGYQCNYVPQQTFNQSSQNYTQPSLRSW
ncbi:hypothetical protein Avbf_07603 [Armadillidium vulgare]|nr:hypothetical protein Avbf_07603 [Armadillidium vulgare]